MDYKITKRRLNDHLSYDWIKYVSIILASVLGWILIFNITSTGIPNNKIFNMYMVVPYTNSAEMNTMQEELRKNLDETAIEVNIFNWNPKDKDIATLINTRFSTKEGDMFLVDNMQKTGNEEKDKDIVSSFNGYVDDGIYSCLEDVIKGAINYIFDEQEYRDRVKAERKFNKIDTEEDMSAAIEKEKLRIQSIKDDAINLAGYLGLASKLGVVSDTAKIDNLAYTYSKNTQTNERRNLNLQVGEPKVWGINIAEVNGALPLSKIKNLISYANDTDTEKDMNAIREYALGIIFAEDNMPYTYTYIKVFNYIIEKYK